MAYRAALAIAAALAAGTAAAQPRTGSEAIGSWVVICLPETGCLMRHREWILPPDANRPSAGLEVRGLDGKLVPVVAIRGLTPQMAMAGALMLKPSVSVQLDEAPSADLTCDAGKSAIVCQPNRQSIGPLAAQFPTARAATIRIAVTMPGVAALPPQERTLGLDGTVLALQRYRAVGAKNESLPAEPGLDLPAFLDRVMRDVGFTHGTADIGPWLYGLAGYGRK